MNSWRAERRGWRRVTGGNSWLREFRSKIHAGKNASATAHLLTTGSIPCYMGSVATVDNLSERLEFLQGTLEVLILRSLQMGPNHAYGISQFIERFSENEFLVDNGSLYPAMQRLVQRAWITSQWKTSPNARRAKYYRLTPLGRKQLVAATSKWQRFVEAMGRVLATKG